MIFSEKIVHNGKVYYPIASAARMLGTTTPKIRKLVEQGDLVSTLLRVGGRTMITAESLATYIERNKVVPRFR